jgi:N,N'-diacetyllegionaminate synthase
MKTLIIAEAGVNHNANIDIAIELVDQACNAKADIIKFQTFTPSEIVTKYGLKATYQNDIKHENEYQLDMMKRIALPLESFEVIKKYCNSKNIEFLTTSFGPISTNFIAKLDMKFSKIPSGEITNLPYLEEIADFKNKIIMSTGMANIDEIKNALNVLYNKGVNKENVTLLHCTSEYPAPFENLNLNALKTLKDVFGLNVGYSDHSLGIEGSIAAVAMGATVIEKHFTLDKNLDGPDHKASIEPKDLKLLVQSIRNIELAFGSSQKKVSSGEDINKIISRKSIVASKNINKGEMFTEENIACKRPGTGLSPMNWKKVIGKISQKKYKTDDFITL